MESKIINQQKNPFLQREEIVFEIKSDVAPSFEEIKKQIGKDENLVVIKKVQGKFGTQIFTTEVFVYDSPEARKKIEVIPKKIKKKLAEEEKTKAEAEAKSVVETAEQPANDNVKQVNKEEKESQIDKDNTGEQSSPDESKAQEKKQ